MIDKPAGLVVHPGPGHASGTLVDALAGKIAGGEPRRPGIVHRLDRDTSGLMVVARSQEAYELLTELVREHALERTYTALVKGRPRSRTGRIEAPIGRDRGDATRVSLDSESAARGDHAFRGAGALAGPRAAARHARDGADAPDSRPSRRGRPAGRRRSDLRRPRARARPPVPACVRALVPASGLGRADRDPVGAAARPGGVPGARRARPGTDARRAAAAATMRCPTFPRPVGAPRWTVAGAHPASTAASPEHRNSNRRKGLTCPSFP